VRRPSPSPLIAAASAFFALVLLAGCDARTNVAATGTAPEQAAHLWVTVEEVWFATAADTVPEAETGWTREKLSSPVVFDLAAIDAGKLVPLVTNVSIPAGDYRQMYVKLADAGDRLLDAAREAGLEYNAQIDVKGGSGSVTKRRLELPVPRTGLAIPVDLTFRDGSGSGSDAGTVNLALTLDAARSVVTYEYGSDTGYVLSPAIRVDDAAKAGSIVGSVGTSALPSGHAPIYISAQLKDDAGERYEVVQRRPVADDGSFTLYPLPAPKSGEKLYDVVIAGAGSDTVVVRDVPVTAGSEATMLQATPIALAAARTVYANVGEQVPALPAGTRVEFLQTLPGSAERPHVVADTSLDPILRGLPDGAFGLAAGPIHVGTYAAGGAIAFSATTPAEGTGGYLVGSSGAYRQGELATRTSDVSGSSGRPTVVTVPFPEVASGGRRGTLTVNLLATPGQYDNGFVAVMAGHELVETVEIGTLLDRGGGLITIAGLPAGAALAPATGIPYRVAVRAWNSRNAANTFTWTAATRSVILGDTGVGAFSFQLQ
jgi:hypothetical protein